MHETLEYGSAVCDAKQIFDFIVLAAKTVKIY